MQKGPTARVFSWWHFALRIFCREKTRWDCETWNWELKKIIWKYGVRLQNTSKLTQPKNISGCLIWSLFIKVVDFLTWQPVFRRETEMFLAFNRRWNRVDIWSGFSVSTCDDSKGFFGQQDASSTHTLDRGWVCMAVDAGWHGGTLELTGKRFRKIDPAASNVGNLWHVFLQGSLNYPYWWNQAIQIYSDFKGCPF